MQKSVCVLWVALLVYIPVSRSSNVDPLILVPKINSYDNNSIVNAIKVDTKPFRMHVEMGKFPEDANSKQIFIFDSVPGEESSTD